MPIRRQESSTRRDFVLDSEGPVAVLQAVSSYEADLRRELPVGDPSLTSPAAVHQHLREHTFVTPPQAAFHFVIISAPADARVELDLADAADRCSESPVPGDESWVVYRCPLSSPTLDSEGAGGTRDSALPLWHELSADRPVAAWVYAFDSFRSHAYAAGKGVSRPEQ